MVDTARPKADHIANFATTGQATITAQDARDLIETLFEDDGEWVLTVAGVDATPAERGRAFLACDGVADDVQLAAAIAALPSGRTTYGTVKVIGTLTVAAWTALPSYTRLCVCHGKVVTATGADVGQFRNQNRDTPGTDHHIEICGGIFDGALQGTNKECITFIRARYVSFRGHVEVMRASGNNITIEGVESGQGGVAATDARTRPYVLGTINTHDAVDKGFYVRRAARDFMLGQVVSRRNGGDGVGIDASEVHIGQVISDQNTGHGLWITNVHTTVVGDAILTRNGKHNLQLRSFVGSAIGSVISRGPSQNTIENDGINAGFTWVAAGGGAGFGHYLTLTAGGGDPGVTRPFGVKRNGDPLRWYDSNADFDGPGQWSYGDFNSLGYETIYVRVGGGDPESDTMRLNGYSHVCLDATVGTHGVTDQSVIGTLIISLNDNLQGMNIGEDTAGDYPSGRDFPETNAAYGIYICSPEDGDPNNEGNAAPSSRLDGAILAGDTSLVLVDSSGFPGNGGVIINGERMTYASNVANVLSGLTRALYDTVADGHDDADFVTLDRPLGSFLVLGGYIPACAAGTVRVPEVHGIGKINITAVFGTDSDVTTWLKPPDAGAPSPTVVGETSYGQAAAAGVSEEYSRGDHTHGTPSAGAGVIPSDTVSDETADSLSPDAGVSTEYARGDHTHGTPVPSGGGGTASATVADETAFGIAPAAGTATEYSRGDHTHGTPPSGAGTAANTVTAETTYGAVSNPGASAEFSRGDHAHGTPVETVVPTASDEVSPEITYGETPAAGTANEYSRSDHTHGTPASDAPVAADTVVAETTYGEMPAAGTSAEFSRADHSHGSPAAAAGTTPATTVEDETTYGIAPAPGVATEYARGDHTHGTPATPAGGALPAGIVDADQYAALPQIVANATTVVNNAGAVDGPAGIWSGLRNFGGSAATMSVDGGAIKAAALGAGPDVGAYHIYTFDAPQNWAPYRFMLVDLKWSLLAGGGSIEDGCWEFRVSSGPNITTLVDVGAGAVHTRIKINRMAEDKYESLVVPLVNNTAIRTIGLYSTKSRTLGGAGTATIDLWIKNVRKMKVPKWIRAWEAASSTTVIIPPGYTDAEPDPTYILPLIDKYIIDMRSAIRVTSFNGGVKNLRHYLIDVTGTDAMDFPMQQVFDNLSEWDVLEFPANAKILTTNSNAAHGASGGLAIFDQRNIRIIPRGARIFHNTINTAMSLLEITGDSKGIVIEDGLNLIGHNEVIEPLARRISGNTVDPAVWSGHTAPGGGTLGTYMPGTLRVTGVAHSGANSSSIFRRAAGSWITDGVVVGDIITNLRSGGWAKISAVTALEVTHGTMITTAGVSAGSNAAADTAAVYDGATDYLALATKGHSARSGIGAHTRNEDLLLRHDVTLHTTLSAGAGGDVMIYWQTENLVLTAATQDAHSLIGAGKSYFLSHLGNPARDGVRAGMWLRNVTDMSEGMITSAGVGEMNLAVLAHQGGMASADAVRTDTGSWINAGVDPNMWLFNDTKGTYGLITAVTATNITALQNGSVPMVWDTGDVLRVMDTNITVQDDPGVGLFTGGTGNNFDAGDIIQIFERNVHTKVYIAGVEVADPNAIVLTTSPVVYQVKAPMHRLKAYFTHITVRKITATGEARISFSTAHNRTRYQVVNEGERGLWVTNAQDVDVTGLHCESVGGSSWAINRPTGGNEPDNINLHNPSGWGSSLQGIAPVSGTNIHACDQELLFWARSAIDLEPAGGSLNGFELLGCHADGPTDNDEPGGTNGFIAAALDLILFDVTMRNLDVRTTSPSSDLNSVMIGGWQGGVLSGLRTPGGSGSLRVEGKNMHMHDIHVGQLYLTSTSANCVVDGVTFPRNYADKLLRDSGTDNEINNVHGFFQTELTTTVSDGVGPIDVDTEPGVRSKLYMASLGGAAQMYPNSFPGKVLGPVWSPGGHNYHGEGPYNVGNISGRATGTKLNRGRNFNNDPATPVSVPTSVLTNGGVRINFPFRASPGRITNGSPVVATGATGTWAATGTYKYRAVPRTRTSGPNSDSNAESGTSAVVGAVTSRVTIPLAGWSKADDIIMGLTLYRRLSTETRYSARYDIIPASEWPNVRTGTRSLVDLGTSLQLTNMGARGWPATVAVITGNVALTATAHVGATHATVFTATGGDFIKDGVRPGYQVRNVTDGSTGGGIVSAVTKTTLTVSALTGGAGNDFVAADVITVKMQWGDSTNITGAWAAGLLDANGHPIDESSFEPDLAYSMFPFGFRASAGGTWSPGSYTLEKGLWGALYIPGAAPVTQPGLCDWLVTR